jgi:uncharacterized membrane protein
LGEEGQLAELFIGRRAGGMSNFFSHPLMLAAVWFAVILGLLAAAIVGLRRWRGDAADDQPATSELITKFRELHARGGLSDDEYRTIKTKLATQLDSELRGNDNTS